MVSYNIYNMYYQLVILLESRKQAFLFLKGEFKMDIRLLKEESLTQITKKEIYKYIKSMDINVSNKLLREEVLAEKLGVSRITVRSALNELATEGIIFRRQGKGTFVNKEALQMKVSLNPIGDLKQVIIDSGYEVDVKIANITTRQASEDETNRLQIKPKSKILVIEKIFYANSKPAIYSIDRIADELFDKDIQKKELELSIFELCKKNLGRKITWDKAELSTVTSEENAVLKTIFQIEGVKSFLNCDIINFDDHDIPIIYTNEYINTEIIRFNLIRQKNFL